MVGLILMKVSSARRSVSPPKPSTKTPETMGMTGSRRSMRQLTATATTVAAMKAAVAVMIPARPLTAKKTTRGPASTASLRN